MTTRRLFLALAAVALVAFFLGRDARGPSARISADGWYYHVYLVSLVGDRDLDFTDEYKATGNWYRFGKTSAGVPANPFGIGPAIYELPFYLAGAAVAALAGQDTGGFGALHATITMLAAPFYSLAALLFAVRLLHRRLGNERLALAAALAIWASGPIVYYALRQPGYAHPFATFFATWLLDAWDRAVDGPRTLRTWLGLGALLGATALARPQLVLWGVIFLPLLWADRRRPQGWLAAGVAALVVFSPQLLAWKAVYGSFLVVPQGPGFMVWEAPRWSEVLFSARNGLFAWAPLWALGAVGLVAALRRAPRLAGWMLLGVLLQLWANAAVWDWWAGGSFGGRRFDSCLLPFAFGLGWLLARRRVVSVPVAVVAALCVAGNVWLAMRSNVFTLPSHTGAPVAAHLARKLPPGLSHGLGAIGAAVTFPARAAFALRHDVGLGIYDRVVGVHLLTEQYPGTGGASKPVEKLRLTGREPWVIGVAPDPRGARMTSGRARMLLSLNQRAPVGISLRASAPVALRWNGVPVAGERLAPVERGVGELELEAPAGTVLEELTLTLR